MGKIRPAHVAHVDVIRRTALHRLEIAGVWEAADGQATKMDPHRPRPIATGKTGIVVALAFAPNAL